MPPAELKDFFIATAGASASFIGLLFVAISFVMNNEKDTIVEQTTKRILAESSYAALINVFFVSLVALIPDTTLSYVMMATAWAGLGASFHYFRKFPGKARHNQSVLIISALVYIAQFIYGITLLTRSEGYTTSKYTIMALFLVLFSLGLTRAWELTGIQQPRERIEHRGGPAAKRKAKS